MRTMSLARGGTSRLLLALLVMLGLLTAACGSDSGSDDSAADDAAETVADADAGGEEAADDAMDDDAMEDDAMEDDAMEDDAMADATHADAQFVSLQFAPVEEAEVLRAILAEGGFDVTGAEEGPTIDQILAGAGEIDVVGALHGVFPPLARENAMTNMADVLDDLSADRDFAPGIVQAGLLGTDDFLYYVPWTQATYVMAAHDDALPYLPDGADLNNLSWEQFGEWCQNILDGEGTQKCGLPKAGLFHRFLEGYLFPSYTGGMVSNFRSTEAIEMMTWVRDTLWPTMHPESINYDFMQEPMLAGEVWVAFDHTARLIEAFNGLEGEITGFPAPSGPAGRGYMPVIVGLGIPADAPNPEAGAAVIEYLTRPEIQAELLAELGWFPVVDGVDFSNLPAGVQAEGDAVSATVNADDALPALLPVGLGDRGGEINQIYRNAFDRIVVDGEDIATALDAEGDNLQTLFDETGAPCWDPDPITDGPCIVNDLGDASASTSGTVAPVDANFVSLQFAPVEEAEKFRAILEGGGIDLTIGEEGPTIDQILAGAGEIDVVGALHGAFPPLAREDALTNMVDVYEDLAGSRDFAEAFVQSGLLGSEDHLAYVPWAQATYIMAANTEALQYLPDGADVQAITWDELATWCQNILDGEGTQKCGLPKAGLFHRFLEGYLFPSFTGGMVSEFRSQAAVDMMEWTRDVLWPTMHPESINYEFMQEPLQSGEVWVAFDHTARLIDAFESDPEQFIGFPAPAGPAGRGFMPVILGLGVPADAPNPDAAVRVIDYLTRPGVQAEVLAQLGFYPVVGGVDFSDLPAGIQIEADTVTAQAASPDALPALLPVGLGDRGGEINQIFRNAFDRIVIDGEDAAAALDAEGDNLQTLFDETGAPCWDPDPITDGPCIVKPAG